MLLREVMKRSIALFLNNRGLTAITRAALPLARRPEPGRFVDRPMAELNTARHDCTK